MKMAHRKKVNFTPFLLSNPGKNKIVVQLVHYNKALDFMSLFVRAFLVETSVALCPNLTSLFSRYESSNFFL